MPITRVLLNSGPSSVRDSKIAKLTVQPAQVLNKLPVQLVRISTLYIWMEKVHDLYLISYIA